MKKRIVVIQPSLRKESYTDVICNIFINACIERKDMFVTHIDFRDRELEFCDGREIHEYNKKIQADYEAIKYADIIILGFPVYHFSISGVLKNYLDIMRDALENKKIDFLVSAIYPGGEIAYEHVLESFHLKYNVIKAGKKTPYILNDMFRKGALEDKKAEKEIIKFALSL